MLSISLIQYFIDLCMLNDELWFNVNEENFKQKFSLKNDRSNRRVSMTVLYLMNIMSMSEVERGKSFEFLRDNEENLSSMTVVVWSEVKIKMFLIDLSDSLWKKNRFVWSHFWWHFEFASEFFRLAIQGFVCDRIFLVRLISNRKLSTNIFLFLIILDKMRLTLLKLCNHISFI